MAKLMQVIHNEEKRGKGTEEDPCRMVTQYFRLDGLLLAEVDPHEKNREDIEKALAATRSNCKYWEDCFTHKLHEAEALEKENAELKAAIVGKAKKGAGK